MEIFLLNTLLRWIIVHTSRLGAIGGHTSAIKETMYDFSLLRICLQSFGSFDRQRAIWETVLREVIAARCDFGAFALGLQELCSVPRAADDKSLIEVIRCDMFDKFAVQAVEDALQDSMLTRSDTFEVFLRTCAGLCGTVRAPLVATAVWSEWVDIARSKEDNPAVGSILSVLLDLVSNQSLIALDENVYVLLMVWHKGGDLWLRNAATLLATPTFEELKSAFLESAGAKLRASLTALCDTSSEGGTTAMRNADIGRNAPRGGSWSTTGFQCAKNSTEWVSQIFRSGKQLLCQIDQSLMSSSDVPLAFFSVFRTMQKGSRLYLVKLVARIESDLSL